MREETDSEMSQNGIERLKRQRMEEIDRHYMEEFEESKNVANFVKHGTKLGKGGKDEREKGFGVIESKQLARDDGTDGKGYSI